MLEEMRFELFFVGRFDKDIEGFLLFINDGQFVYWFFLFKKYVFKMYEVYLKLQILLEDIFDLEMGVYIEGGYKIKFVKVEIKVNDNGNIVVYLIIIEGKFYQVKQMVKVVGNEVIYLKWFLMGLVFLDFVLVLGEYCEFIEEEFKWLNEL